MQSCPHQPRRCHQDDNEGYRTRYVPFPCCWFARWLWSTVGALGTSSNWAWMLFPAWWLGTPPWGKPPALGKALSKTQSEAQPAKVPGCPAGWSSGDIPPPRDLSNGYPAAPVGLKPTGGWQDTREVPPLTRGLEAWQARVCGASILHLPGLAVRVTWDLLQSPRATLRCCRWPTGATGWLSAGMELKLPHESMDDPGGREAQGWKP